MLTSTKQDILNKDASIDSSHKITLEWNYNSFLRKTSYGCYKTDYNTAYQSDNSSSYYDNGLSKQLFETDGLDTTMTQLTAGSSTITVASATGIVTGMKVSGESIPADTYVTNVSGTTITISNSTAESITSLTPVYFYNYRIEDDYYREKYTPILSIFEPNRPDPGIINLVSYRKGSEIIDSEKLKAGNFGSANSGTLEDRVYPISTTAPYRYWNSLRNVVSSNLLSLVGVSASNSSISYAAPFVVYNDSFWSNKIVIKTQKKTASSIPFVSGSDGSVPVIRNSNSQARKYQRVSASGVNNHQSQEIPDEINQQIRASTACRHSPHTKRLLAWREQQEHHATHRCSPCPNPEARASGRTHRRCQRKTVGCLGNRGSQDVRELRR